ncbi:MAG: efflux RND transporter periplasmic adaptor subunit, partial [Ignavibacteriaceae bacterium]
PESTSTNASNEIKFPVTASVVRKGKLISWINTSGYAYPVQEFEIKPKISGQVTTLSVFNGKQVNEGDILFKLDDTKYKLDIDEAKSNLVKAQIDYELQRSYQDTGNNDLKDYKLKFDSVEMVYKRDRTLYNNHQISYDKLKQVERNYKTLKTIVTLDREDIVAMRSGLTNAITNYDKAKLGLDYTRLAAPISGLVSDCNTSSGSYINAGQLCLKVIDIYKIKIHCEVTESDLVNIKPGDSAEADFIALPDKKFKGKVIEVNPSVDLTKRTALVTVILNNPGLLIKSGMFASIKIGTQIIPNVVIIPHSSLLVRDNRTLVFTVNNGLASWKYVTMGKSNDEFYIIKKGISVGDTLIIGGNYNLAHQSKVRIDSIEKY